MMISDHIPRRLEWVRAWLDVYLQWVAVTAWAGLCRLMGFINALHVPRVSRRLW